MTYRITGLDPKPFRPLFAQDDASLAAAGIRRVTADATPGYPCRVSLADAEPGEDLLLLNHEHHAVAGPYRSRHAIFVRAKAERAAVFTDRLPEALAIRLLSLRAFDAEGLMVDAEVAEGAVADGLIRRYLADPRVAEVHLHFARRGCFAARATRD